MKNPLDNRFSDLNKQGFMKFRKVKKTAAPIYRNGYLIEKCLGSWDVLSYKGSSPISMHKTRKQAEDAADKLEFNK